MTLASVETQGEDAFLAPVGWDTWLGAADSAAEGQWKWTASNQAFWTGGLLGHVVPNGYANWGLARPWNTTLQNCMSKSVLGGKWVDANCANLNAWVCEGPESNSPQLPDSRDCTLVESQGGRWKNVTCDQAAGYVCESLPAVPLGSVDETADIVRESARDGRPQLTHATFSDPGARADLFLATPERFGARECVDTFEPSTSPFVVASLGLEVIEYGQRYKGVPVVGRGYVVHRDPATHAIRMVHGSADSSIELSVQPAITETVAFAAAVQAIGGGNPTSYSPREPGTLSIVSATQGPDPEWHLAWRFAIPPRGSAQGYGISISASDARVLELSPWLRQECKSINLSTAQNPTAEVIAVETDINVQDADNPYDPYVPLIGGYNTAPAQKIPGTACVDCDGSCSGGVCTCAAGTPCNDAYIALYSSGTPVRYIQCAEDSYPNVAAVESTAVTVKSNDIDPNDPDAQDHRQAAAYYMAAQRCLEFLRSTDAGGRSILEAAPAQPWLGLDPLGAIPLAMKLDRVSPFGTYFNPEDYSIHVDPDARPPEGAAIETLCHEIAHGISQTIRSEPCGSDVDCINESFGMNAESAAINEGIGDIIGNAAEMRVRGYPGTAGPDPLGVPGGFCYGGDEADNITCQRNFAEPEVSDVQPFDPSYDGCWLVLGANGNLLYDRCPRDYGGPDFCSFGNACRDGSHVECCDEHSNATVLSHWFYLLTVGGQGVNQSVCSYEIEGCDPDLRTSTEQGLQILFSALREHLSLSGAGFLGLAEATITSARLQFGEDSRQYRSVVHAWYAVNVREDLAEGPDASVIEPPRGDRGVNPWLRLTHLLEGNDQSHEFRIATLPLGGPGTHTITTEERGWMADNRLGAIARAALPSGDGHTYYWQSRPVGGDPWSCYPIHWFYGTGVPDDIESHGLYRYPNQPVSPDGKEYPGQVGFEFDTVEGAVGFEIQVSTVPRNCGPVLPQDNVRVVTISQEDDFETQTAFVHVLQPSEHYYYSIQAIGPPSLIIGDNSTPVVGPPVRGACHTGTFDTTALRPPEVTRPSDVGYFEYRPPHHPLGSEPSWEWRDRDGAHHFVVSFYVLGDDGRCNALYDTRSVSNSACFDAQLVGCPVRPSIVLPPARPLGYCWNVVSVAANGQSSPASTMRRIQYVLPSVQCGGTGIDIGFISNPGTHPTGKTDRLADDSYGQPVVLDWEHNPDASSYLMKIGRWPWRYPSSPPWPESCRVPGVSGYCELGPKEVTYVGIAADAADVSSSGRLTKEVDARVGGEGRYCYSIAPQVLFSLQPDGFQSICCYTTGPAKPVIELESALPSPDAPFSTAPIDGLVRFPYAPSGRIDFRWGDAQLEILERSPECDVEVEHDPYAWALTREKAWLFGDIYDCEIKFRITPREGELYELVATALGETTDQVETLSIETGTCGARGESCCPGQECDVSWLECDASNRCACGARGQPCCNESPDCSSTTDECIQNVCELRRRPDIVVDDIFGAFGACGKITVQVSNNGTATLTQDFDLLVTQAVFTLEQTTARWTKDLAPGTSDEINIFHAITFDEVAIRADASNEVEELSETNNYFPAGADISSLFWTNPQVQCHL